MAHDAIPLQSKSLGNKATEGHMPLIFAILLQNFVHGRIYINAISSTINPDFATGDDNKNFGSFFSQGLRQMQSGRKHGCVKLKKMKIDILH